MAVALLYLDLRKIDTKNCRLEVVFEEVCFFLFYWPRYSVHTRHPTWAVSCDLRCLTASDLLVVVERKGSGPDGHI